MFWVKQLDESISPSNCQKSLLFVVRQTKSGLIILLNVHCNIAQALELSHVPDPQVAVVPARDELMLFRSEANACNRI